MTMTRALSASTITGDPVTNANGESLGNIEEIVIDLDSGRVAYTVLAAGGFLGLGEKFFAIPWDMVTVDMDNKEVIIDIEKELLEKAPGFDKDNWPDMADPAFGKQIYSYYGYKEYWDEGDLSDREFDRDRNRTLSGGGGV
jgi:sporulation protein YlmC with PRC-barrel domain